MPDWMRNCLRFLIHNIYSISLFQLLNEFIVQISNGETFKIILVILISIFCRMISMHFFDYLFKIEKNVFAFQTLNLMFGIVKFRNAMQTFLYTVCVVIICSLIFSLFIIFFLHLYWNKFVLIFLLFLAFQTNIATGQWNWSAFVDSSEFSWLCHWKRRWKNQGNSRRK